MRYRSFLLFSSAVALAIAGCSASDDITSGGNSGASGRAGASGSAGKGGSAGKAGAGTAGVDVTPEGGAAGEPSTPTPTAGAAGEAGGGEAGGGEAGGSEGGAAGESSLPPLSTLDGTPPLIIGHRGLPGLHPEETVVSYQGAVDAGADSLEEDLHLSKDCVLVARHNPWLSDNTNITAVAATNATVAARKRTVPGKLINVTYDVATYGGPTQYLSDLTDAADPKSVLKSLVVDGDDHTNDWSITDFTVVELKRWFGGTTFDQKALRPTAENGIYPILTMQEIIDLAKAQSQVTGRTISVYPEAKNPYWNNQQAIANGCGTGTNPFEDAIIKLINDNGLNSKTAPILVQSFDPASLKYMRAHGLLTKAVQLIDAWDVDVQTGDMVYIDTSTKTKGAGTFIDGRPYSWTVSGKGDLFSSMLTPAGLSEVKTYADGIGPWKPQVMKWQVVPAKVDAGYSDVTNVTPTTLIADAHAKGLFVHTYTFRSEPSQVPAKYKGNPAAEYLDYFVAGIDGVFTDFANTGFAARANFLSRVTK